FPTTLGVPWPHFPSSFFIVVSQASRNSANNAAILTSACMKGEGKCPVIPANATAARTTEPHVTVDTEAMVRPVGQGFGSKIQSDHHPTNEPRKLNHPW